MFVFEGECGIMKILKTFFLCMIFLINHKVYGMDDEAFEGYQISGSEKSQSLPAVGVTNFGDVCPTDILRGMLLNLQEDSLIQGVKRFLNEIEHIPGIVRKCFDLRIPIKTSFEIYDTTFFDIFTSYALKKDDFVWIVEKMKKCGRGGRVDKDFIWKQLNSTCAFLNLSFFHRMITVNDLESIQYMFGVLCECAPSSKVLGDFLLRTNSSKDCIFTCICYSSVLSSDEKVRLLDILVKKFWQIVKENYEESELQRLVMSGFLTRLNECILVEVIRIALYIHRHSMSWLIPFIETFIGYLNDFCGNEVIKLFVNRIVGIKIDTQRKDSKMEYVTALDLTLNEYNKAVHDRDVEVVGFLSRLIEVLKGKYAKTARELQLESHMIES